MLPGQEDKAMTVRERLIRAIEQAPEPVLEATLEALEDALDVFAAKAALAEMKANGEAPELWSKVKTELGLDE
jgi:hypothetical protein